MLAVLRRQSAATTTLLHDGGQVFSALSRSPSTLQSFVRNTNALFAATAARDTELADTIRAFPAFLGETRSTIDRLATFAQTTKPLIDELHPAAVQLTPALQRTHRAGAGAEDPDDRRGPADQRLQGRLPGAGELPERRACRSWCG